MATLKVKPKSQQEFLRDAMVALDMDEIQFALRIGAAPDLFARWMKPSTDPVFKLLPEPVWKHVSEILQIDSKHLTQFDGAGVSRGAAVGKLVV